MWRFAEVLQWKDIFIHILFSWNQTTRFSYSTSILKDYSFPKRKGQRITASGNRVVHLSWSAQEWKDSRDMGLPFINQDSLGQTGRTWSLESLKVKNKPSSRRHLCEPGCWRTWASYSVVVLMVPGGLAASQRLTLGLGLQISRMTLDRSYMDKSICSFYILLLETWFLCQMICDVFP